MTENERNYYFYQAASEYLCNHAEGLTDSILAEYFVNPRKKDLDEAFGVVVSSAVDWYKTQARVIAYDNRHILIEEILGNHKLSYVINSFNNDPKKLFSTFKEKISFDNRQFTEDIWLSYANCICGMAQYLSKFKNANEMYKHFDKFKTTNEKIKLINEIMNGAHIIKTRSGWGFALSANWLKDIGMLDYCKPDVQLKKYSSSLELCSKTDQAVFKTFVNIAEDSKKYDKTASAFKLDRILWLIGSGNFYNHPEIKWNGSFEEFISEVKPKIK